MPWKAITTMSQCQEFVELALKENANVRALCREFGITPRAGYKWIKRYQEQGEVGLYDRGRRPKSSSHKSNAVIEEAVLKVRRAHPAWGGRKIQWKLVQDGIKPPPVGWCDSVFRLYMVVFIIPRRKEKMNDCIEP